MKNILRTFVFIMVVSFCTLCAIVYKSGEAVFARKEQYMNIDDQTAGPTNDEVGTGSQVVNENNHVKSGTGKSTTSGSSNGSSNTNSSGESKNSIRAANNCSDYTNKTEYDACVEQEKKLYNQIDQVFTILLIALPILAGVTSAVLGYQIVQSADEPQQRSEHIKKLKSILIGFVLAYALIIILGPATGFIKDMLEKKS